MIRSFIVTGILLFTCLSLNAQIVFNEPATLKAVIRQYITENKSKTEVDGWRIQVLATTDRRQMEQAYKRFQDLFPEIDIHWVHEQPYYRLKVGAFHERRECLPLCQEIRKHFTQALPVTERVELEEIINQ